MAEQECMPVIRVTVEGIRESITTAMAQWALTQDDIVQKAIEKFCTPENVGRIIEDQVATCLESSIRESVNHFFRYGEGRKAVLGLVEKKLRSMIDSMAEDPDGVIPNW